MTVKGDMTRPFDRLKYEASPLWQDLKMRKALKALKEKEKVIIENSVENAVMNKSKVNQCKIAKD